MSFVSEPHQEKKAWRRRAAVLSMAAVTALVAGTAVTVVASHHTTVAIDVDGVTMPFTTWASTVGETLHSSGVEVGEHDLVSPGLNEHVGNDTTITVRTAHPYSVKVDGEEKVAWSTGSNAASILSDIGSNGANIAMVPNRSNSRSELMPLVAQSQQVPFIVDGKRIDVQARPGEDVRELLASEQVNIGPLDQVELTYDSSQVQVHVIKVERKVKKETEHIDLPIHEEKSDELFEGEYIVKQKAVSGERSVLVWTEDHDGQVVHEGRTAGQEITKPKEEIRVVGTKKATPEALLSAGFDPASQPKEDVGPDGKRSMRYKDKAPVDSPASYASTNPADDPSRVDNQKAYGVDGAFQSGNHKTYTGDDPQGIAHSMVLERGWNESEFTCLVTLWNRESNWNPYAENKSSGAYGIPQSLPGTKMASAGADWRTNPATQIKWGLGYISGRYGTPCGALAHSHSVGWY